MFEQYLQIKEDHPDALLFYRMGDFYELFFEDAEIAARELQISLTCRNPNAEIKTPMCGVPHHAVKTYLSRLLEKGFKIALCDQIEDPKQAKGLVKRAVTRVYTPGTVIEDSTLNAKSNNFLAALIWDEAKSAGGLAWMDFSTGQWSGIQSKTETDLWQWAIKVGPRELILQQGKAVPHQYGEIDARITPAPSAGYFNLKTARDNVLEVQKVADLESLDLEDKPQLTQACGALIAYLRQTQMQELNHLGEFKPLNLSKYMVLDEVTERNLELFKRLDGKKGKGTLLAVIDKTITPMGGRLLSTRLKQPWRDLSPIEHNQKAVTFFHDNDSLRASIRKLLDTVYDLERLSTRVVLGRANPKDFISLRQSLKTLPPIQEELRHAVQASEESDSIAIAPALKTIVSKWDSMSDVADLLEKAMVDSPPPVITEGGLFKLGYNAELDEFIELTEHGEAKLAELLQHEKESCDLPKLKIGYNKVFGYYFEISKAFKGQVPDYFERRQTLVNCERYISPQLKELEEKLISAFEQRKKLEYNLFQAIRDEVAENRSRFMFMADAIAAIDFWQGLAEAARSNRWVCPEVHTGMEVIIEEGRHPVVEAVQGSANYIPNNLTIDEKRRILLITGPNMAGKSTVLRQIALMGIMAQMGSYIPASSGRIGLIDRVFSRVGASDNLAQGQSTFMVEMMETARILRQATMRSLVILDEIGRGTSTFDGLALAWAVVEELSRRARGGIRTLFATHYHELTSLEGVIDGLRNFNIAVREWKGDILFLRRLVPGPADKSYGIEVAKLAGVPRPVVLRAREILANLEEKSQDSNLHPTERKTIVQSILPGMICSGTNNDKNDIPPEDHEIIKELRHLDINGLSPIEAITLLNQWKKSLGDN
ncbi:DNA mismatch repair protein MutS [Maridesulfovibrio ferrireducens]|uniref:DNA mismatch repair protein MutS n=1 Tax=Maridesulfovibrio ferrireducens TaxID=246191 RepID=A0A1G9I361_9BACT|nr:DNA mismatch repair protein MutS [Maridesulfovibrio ferrireducens]SDL19687.1 DNA mismatch repair protein MutS [Maridesulfovibrio ferrireducens]